MGILELAGNGLGRRGAEPSRLGNGGKERFIVGAGTSEGDKWNGEVMERPHEEEFALGSSAEFACEASSSISAAETSGTLELG